MNLLSSQKGVLDKLYSLLVDDGSKAIVLTGDVGSGKHTIVTELLNVLKEDWSFHKIYTEDFSINSNTEIETTKKLKLIFIPSINFSMGLCNIGVSLRFKESQKVFSDIENQFVKDIKNTIEKNKLIIIENYKFLSNSTKQFLNTILSRIIKNNPSIYFLISTINKNDLPYQFLSAEEVGLKALNKEDCKALLGNNVEEKKIIELLKLTGGNINYLLNIANHKNSYQIDEIIAHRLALICDENQELKDKYIDLMTLSSYLHIGLSANEILSIYENNNSLYTLEKLFSALLKIKLIDKKENKYFVSIDAFKSYFKSLEPNLSSYYYDKLYNYFTENYDYEYEIRLHYLQLKLYYSNSSDYTEYIVLKFFMMANHFYLNLKHEPFSEDTFLKDIPFQFRNNNLDLIQDIAKLSKLFEILSQEEVNWNLAFDLVKNFQFENLLMHCEIERLAIEIYSNIKNSTMYMNDKILHLNYYRKNIENYSKEKLIWLRITNTIISHCENRANLHKLSIEIYEDFMAKLILMKNNEISKYYLNLLNRKSVLFVNPDIAIENINKSIIYFQRHNNTFEYFKGCVNALGTYLVTNDYDKAEIICEKIKALITDHDFFEVEKFYNNYYLLSLLDSNKGKNEIEILQKFEELHRKFPNTKVIHLNYISLMVSLGKDLNNVMLNNFLDLNAQEYNNDAFYLYYLNDLKLANLICQKNWCDAEKQYEYLSKVNIPKFYNNENYCLKRLEAYNEIIKNRTPYDFENFNDALYNTLIKNKKFYGYDKGWQFMSKGFILSDLQFFD